MKPLRRHQLVWLDEFAWHRVLASGTPLAASTEAADCLAHWAEQRWPLVVTRQTPQALAGTADALLALGLAAPARWGRRAISVTASLRGVTRQAAFPLAAEISPLLPAAAQPGWVRLCEQLCWLGVVARVYGSYGWQHITGMDYVHAGSDIDLLIDVGNAVQADQAGALLCSAQTGRVRIDGELVFEDGAAVAWREWLRYRSGQVDSILAKRISGASLECGSAWGALA